MSSSLYMMKKPEEPSKESIYELKFLMRTLLDTDIVDHEITSEYIPMFKGAFAATSDNEISNSLHNIIERLTVGEVLIFKEEW